MKNISIGIDGPAGAGKSSVSKAVAGKLGFVYIDTGAMYRAAALFAMNNGIDIVNERERLISNLDKLNITIKYTAEGQRIFLDGKDVSETIRTPEVSVGSSNVAVIPEVREKLVAMQREMAKHDNVIMDGRDICTVVLPNADVKIFLTASVEERAKRRYKEMTEKGMSANFEEIKRDIEYRDKNDSERAASPLKIAEGAAVVDTTGLTFDEVVEKLTGIIKEKKEKI